MHADALSRLPAEVSKGPELDEVIGDYYLPLNVIRKETDEGFEENRNVKKNKSIWDGLNADQLYGTAGMSSELYVALVDYLKEWKYPVSYTEK